MKIFRSRSKLRFKEGTDQQVKERMKGCFFLKEPLLDLCELSLNELPEALLRCHHITDLLAMDNKLSSLPAGLHSKFQRLSIVVLNGNHLCDLPEDFLPPNLKTLDLRCNKFTDIPPCVYNLKTLERLLLGQNKLTKVDPGIGKLTRLRFLSLRNNKLTGLPEEIGLLTQLSVLDAQYNSLTSIPEDIGKCQELTSLDLKNNQIVYLPESIGDLRKLRRIGLMYNSLTKLPASLQNC
jgi:Leucine-rich repeat (LRR) protein